MRGGNQTILDLVLRQKEQKTKTQPLAQPQKIKKTEELPEPEPNDFPQQMPEPQDLEIDQPVQARAGAAEPQPKIRDEIPLVSYAKHIQGNKAITRGKVPPVPPPQPLARPRGPLEEEAADPLKKQRSATGQIPAEPQAKQPQAMAPQPEANRFPQGALLGPKARQDIEARTLFDRAKEALDTRRFDEALNGFEQFLKNYPDHPLAEEAHFRLADASLYKNERNILPAYDQVMFNYQKAVDLYPKSDQVPWAFSMMGEAALLAQEPYKAVGYFDMVTEDYPKSEYVPLAKVKKGAAYLAQAKYRRAIDEYREVSEKYPDSRFRRDADWGQARALFGIARYERASLLLKDMDRRDQNLRVKEPELLYYIGEAEYQLKRYESARRYFLWALNIMPDIPYADIMLTRVGDTYQFEKEYNTARDIYRRVVEKWPETDGGLVARIRLAESPKPDEKHPVDLFQIEATTDAFETYKEIAEKYPERQVAQLAQLKLGVYYYKKEQYNKALEVLSKLLQRHPRTAFRPDVDYTRNLAAMALLAEFKEQNQPYRLMEYYLKNQDILTRPNSNQVLRLLAWAYDQAGLSKRAAKLYEILMVRGEDEPAINLALARNRMKEREYKAVEALLSKDELARLKGDDLILARSLLARSLARQKKCKQANRVFTRLLAKAPNHKDAPMDYQAWADCLADMKQYKKGLAALEKASALLKEQTDINSGLQRYITVMQAGSLARRAGLLDRAITEFIKAQDLAPTIRERAQAIYETAMAYKQAGKPEKLAPSFQRLVKFKVKPWSDMAARHLKDMELAPSLAQVGR
jgi:TolA-binding protein